MMNYLEFFQLQEDPFGLTPDTSYFYPSKMHKDILASLHYAVDQKEGFSLVIGEPGTGKTTILKMFINQWKGKAEIALIMTPRLSPEELLQAVLEDLKIDLPTMNKNDMIKAFIDFLIGQSISGKRVIIVVDEAQNLSDTALEELRLLSNLETEKEKLLQIILVGQPELQRRLSSEGLRQLNQRITIRAALMPLTLDETSDYMAFRLVKAGKGSAVFDQKARNTIYRLSGGIPRLINLLASRAMMVAYISAAHHIRKKHATEAAKHLSDVPPRPVSWRRIWSYSAICIVIVSFLPISIVLYHRYGGGLDDARTVAPVKSGIERATPASPAEEVVPPPEIPSERPRKAIVAAHAARLREKPSTHAGIDMVVTEGESLEITDEWVESDGKRWFKVKTADGKEHWIASHIVREVSPR